MQQENHNESKPPFNKEIYNNQIAVLGGEWMVFGLTRDEADELLKSLTESAPEDVLPNLKITTHDGHELANLEITDPEKTYSVCLGNTEEKLRKFFPNAE